MPIGPLGMAAVHTGQDIVRTGMGLLLEKHNDRRQIQQQQKLQNLQIAGSKEMVDYNTAKQLQMWKDTNYGPQMEQLKAAGLNPGLIYGMSGGGATTTGQATGTTQGGHAPTGGGEILALQQMGIQRQLLDAQRRNIEADTKVKEATIPKVTTETQSLAQGILNQKAQQKLTEIETELKSIEAQVKGKTIQEQQDIIFNAAAKGIHEIDILEQENLLQREQRILKTDLLRQQVANELIKAAVMEKGIEVNDAQMKKWTTEIAQAWDNLDRQDRELILKGVEAEIKKDYPGLWNVIGGFISGSSRKLGELFGDKHPEIQDVIKKRKKQ